MLQINVDKTDMRIENGELIIKINADLEKVLGINRVALSSVNPGQVIEDEFVVVKHHPDGTTEVWRRDLLDKKMEFGKSNDWRDSYIRKYLNDTYLPLMEQKFGKDNIVSHEVDLRSLDGLRTYGKCMDKVSIPTLDGYRDYREIIPKTPNWYWLSTPHSTPAGVGAGYVQYVDSCGRVCYRDYYYALGLRPVLYLKSSIFVSAKA